MAFTLICNDNFLGITSLDFGDLNVFGHQHPFPNGTYWHTAKGTGLNAKLIYDYMYNNGYSTPLYPLTVENIKLALDGEHEEIMYDFQNNRFWLVGGFEKGFGVYFDIDRGANRIGINSYSYNPETEVLKNDCGFVGNASVSGVSSGSTDNIIYLIDFVYWEGTIQPSLSGVLQAPYEVTVREDTEREWYYYNNIDMVIVNDTDSAWEGAIKRKAPFFAWDNYNMNRDWLTDARNSPYTSLPDPYKNTGGNTQPDGGNGTPRSSYDIDQPELPPDLLLESGIVKMYSPTPQQMNDFINYVYTSPEQIITNFKKIWVEPMQSIISLATVPFIVPKKPATEIVKFCGVSTGVAMYPVASQYFQLDCGDLTLPEETNSFLDYNNNTTIQCFLPFVGIVHMSTNDIMNATLNLIYNIDLLTGDCLVSIKCTKNDKNYGIRYASPLYEFKGNVLSQAPLSGNNYQQLYNGVLGLVEQIAMPSNIGGVVKAGLDVATSQMVSVQRAGSLAGNCGELGQYFPYLIIECPIASTTDSMYEYQGLPTNMNRSVEDMIGSGLTYAQKDTLRINTVVCTSEEEKEIIQLFEGGVIL